MDNFGKEKMCKMCVFDSIRNSVLVSPGAKRRFSKFLPPEKAINSALCKPQKSGRGWAWGGIKMQGQR